MKRALVIIDMQQGFFREAGAREKLERHLPAVNQTISAFSDAGLPVVLARTIHRRDRSTWTQKMRREDKGVMLEGTADVADVSGLRVPGEAISLVKTRHSAFIRTNLEMLLRARGIGGIVLAGIFLEACVGETAADAAQLDFDVGIAREATMTCDDGTGRAVLEMIMREFEVSLLGMHEVLAAISVRRLPDPLRAGHVG